MESALNTASIVEGSFTLVDRQFRELTNKRKGLEMEMEPPPTNIPEPTETQQEPTPRDDSTPDPNRIPSETKNAPGAIPSVSHGVIDFGPWF